MNSLVSCSQGDGLLASYGPEVVEECLGAVERWSSAGQEVDDSSEVVHLVGRDGNVRDAECLTELPKVLNNLLHAAGLAFLPLAAAVGVGGKAASGLVAHAGSKAALVLGLVVEGGGALLLARVPADATYLNVLPGLVAIGFGLGFSFVAAPLIVMSRVSSEDSGMVSGLMQTAHETGISLGVAALSAIATAATVSGGLATGYREGMFVAAVVAGVLALSALIAVPSTWPAAATGTRTHAVGMRMHGATSSSQDPA